MNRRKAVFLDRDGVVNRAVVREGKPYPPDTLADFELLPGAAQAMKTLRAAGYLVIVVTNQPDVATGKQSQAVVDAMHERLRSEGLVDDIRVCLHVDADQCDCRKPRPGMLLQAAAHWNIDLAASHLVGDRWRDIDAARAAGVQPLFINYGYRERQPEPACTEVRSLAHAQELITGPMQP